MFAPHDVPTTISDSYSCTLHLFFRKDDRGMLSLY